MKKVNYKTLNKDATLFINNYILYDLHCREIALTYSEKVKKAKDQVEKWTEYAVDFVNGSKTFDVDAIQEYLANAKKAYEKAATSEEKAKKRIDKFKKSQDYKDIEKLVKHISTCDEIKIYQALRMLLNHYGIATDDTNINDILKICIQVNKTNSSKIFKGESIKLNGKNTVDCLIRILWMKAFDFKYIKFDIEKGVCVCLDNEEIIPKTVLKEYKKTLEKIEQKKQVEKVKADIEKHKALLKEITNK